MPRVQVIDPSGMQYMIATRQTETLLKAWFDEVLPWTYVEGRPGIDDFDVLWPRVLVWPMWAWKLGSPSDPDWLCDSRAMGHLLELRAKDGESGLAELLRIRRELEDEIRTGRRDDYPSP